MVENCDEVDTRSLEVCGEIAERAGASCEVSFLDCEPDSKFCHQLGTVTPEAADAPNRPSVARVMQAEAHR